MRHTTSYVFAGCASLVISGATAAQQSGDAERGEFWYFPAAEGVSLFIHETGEGEPVVVLHGGPGADHSYMHDIASGLTDRHRFVFYDQRGSLRSPAYGVAYTIADHVADLDALRSALGLSRMNVVAHSAGTTLLYHYLSAHPERVGNVVLVGAVDPVNGAPGQAIFDEEDRALFAEMASVRQAFHNRPAVQQAIREAGLESPPTARDSARLAVLRQYSADVYDVSGWEGHVPLRINPEAAQETQQSIDWNYDRTELLSGHRYPVTVINGEHDYVVGPRGSPIWKKLAARRMPNVRVVVVPDAGHAVWIDEPRVFAEAAARALGR
jgi:pimeloyl-ACP methyl ester carboxylesterase